MKVTPIKQQLKNNLIALISIVIAIASLSYNTWRNEQTEYNRNVRTSSFEILMSLAELQLLADYAFYSDDSQKYDPIKGWSHILYVNSLAETVSGEVKQNVQSLHQSWQENWQQMHEQEESLVKITNAINITRQSVLTTLKDLQ